MSDEKAFDAAMATHPRNELPRLVYADWLDEHGDPRGDSLRRAAVWAKLPAKPESRAYADFDETDPRHLLLREIARYPDELYPYLYYADWLSKNDDISRAGFIRSQCTLEFLEENSWAYKNLLDKILKDYARLFNRWSEDFVNELNSRSPERHYDANGPMLTCTFRRGFVREVHILFEDMQHSLPGLADYPVDTLICDANLGQPDAVEDLMRDPAMSRIRHLHLSGWVGDPHLFDAIAGNPEIAFKTVFVSSVDICDADIHKLIHSPAGKAMEELHVRTAENSRRITDATARELAQWDNPRLKSLTLEHTAMTVAGLKLLADSPSLRHVPVKISGDAFNSHEARALCRQLASHHPAIGAAI